MPIAAAMTSETLAIARPRPMAIMEAILAGFHRHAILYGFAGVVIATALLEAWLLQLPFDFQMVKIFSGPVLLILTVMILAGLVMEMVRLARLGHEGSAVTALWHKLRDDYLAPMRVANAVHAFLFMSAYMVGYTFIKKAIPSAHPFSWDEAFMLWDKALHGGQHPYELLSFLNVPAITFLLNVNYNMWFFVMFSLWFWQGFNGRDTRLRLHFLLGFTLTWFLGTCILGTVFSSVGPCFYGRLIPGADPFARGLAWLTTANETHPIWSLRVMDELWRNYETGTGLVNGISAMPSMHVGTSVLFAILGFASGKRWLGWTLSVFAGLIMIGSVHLTWHYAIDGYAGAVIAVFGWWLAGKLIDWARPDLATANPQGAG
jgi:PAP2 superfamily